MDLSGVYFRNGPDPLHPPRDGDQSHWFHGDGMIQRFEFADGRVSWKNRWVRTEKYELERAAGKSLFGVLGNPMTADPAVAGKHYKTANTHIVWDGNRLMALEPKTLATIDNFNYHGAINGPIAAYPKFDHGSGEMVFFGNQAKWLFSECLRLNIADKNGRLIKKRHGGRCQMAQHGGALVFTW